ncbi:inactive ubiquitin carboxyl-terminal hydrolase MINDY-4B [Sitodiplosis mosellana]|uniref:inactive ubiquitin carboxyl-terminal hydrolase MINDY-4B n=1 Tax=Sitodiplosis mosellana TaxID=263140 RepID=UPI002444EA5E|nr:inactive ubiquitin carboxyl-terminal hydrolase MINDY-4B [Sitodiplosis mosellana]
MANRTKLVGGIPINVDQAIELRKSVFGSASAPPRGEWTRTPLCFCSYKEEHPYGLRSPKNASRGLQSVLQAYIMKHFLFSIRPRGEKKSVPIDILLKPTEAQQNEALIAAISEILWNIGEKVKVVIVLTGETNLIPHSHTYFQDSVTEKLLLFEFTKLDDLEIFLKRYLYFFCEENGAGALLFLYSAVLTRTPSKVITDLDGPKGTYLMGTSEEGSLNIVTLLLTGHATPYLHNGVIYVGDEDHYALPQFGILSRSSIGLLILENESHASSLLSRQPGSRLKTPALPIWVSIICGHYGVMFNSNRELLRNYHAEKRFELHYYTCAGNYLVMTIDNRSQADNDTMSNNAGNSNNVPTVSRDDGTTSLISRLIHTKWADAKISIKGSPSSSLLM